MPIYTHKCERCGRLEDRLYKSFQELCSEPSVRCLVDGSRMERVPSAPAFTVGGDYTAANGYSKAKS